MTARSDVHVSWRDLVDRRDGVLMGPRGAAAFAHLDRGCATCEAAASEIESLVTAIADGQLEAPPRHAADAAIRAFRESLSAFTRQADRVLGVLIADSAEALEPSLRATTGASRRLLWRVGEFEVDAELVPGAGGADLVAQIIPPGDDPAQIVSGVVTARGPRGATVSARLAPDGRFTFRALSPGVYAIDGAIDSLRFVLPPVHVE